MKEIMKKQLVFVMLSIVPMIIFAQPKDAANLNWSTEIPRVVYPDKEMIDLYEKTWELAAARVRIGPEGLPASPYLDENCYDDQIWIWDSCFMVLFSKYAPNTFPGRQTLDNLYWPIHENHSTPLRIHLRDNPPLFAWVEYNNYLFSSNKEHVKYILDDKKYIQQHFDYFNSLVKGEVNKKISPNPIFLENVKDENGKLIGFTWTGGASGMDNTPRGRDAGGYRKILWIDAISQQALSALYISHLAQVYGDKKQARSWIKCYNDLKKLINERYWDEQDGYYYDVEIATGKPCRIKTPASFWAMLAEIPNKKQARRMIDYICDEKYMGGEYPWNSLSRDDKDYNNESGDYWRGGIWLPLVYMGTKALERYGYYELADSLAAKVIRQQLNTYKAVTPHTIWECYNPSADLPSTEHGRRARPDFCGWSALGPISLFIENILGFREINALNRTIRWTLKKENQTHGLRNLKFGKIVTDIVYDHVSNKIVVKANEPYVLIVNGKKHRVYSGETSFIYR